MIASYSCVKEKICKIQINSISSPPFFDLHPFFAVGQTLMAAISPIGVGTTCRQLRPELGRRCTVGRSALVGLDLTHDDCSNSIFEP